MKGQPIFGSGFKAPEQRFETVEPRVGALNGRALAVEVGADGRGGNAGRRLARSA